MQGGGERESGRGVNVVGEEYGAAKQWEVYTGQIRRMEEK